MTNNWESTFSQWAQSPGDAEQTRSDNAIKIIRNAIDRHVTLGPRLRSNSIKLFVQGSYRNRVNVRKDSDVDVGVLYKGTFFADYPAGYDRTSFDHVAATYSYRDFKNDIERALIDYLGEGMLTRGNKSIKVRETSYHVEADVAPFFEYRRYIDAAQPPIPGVELRPDNGHKRVINFPEALFPAWPKEHYENGRDKNDATHRRYRGLVRILKNIRNRMEDSGYALATPIPGYLLECLTWNAPERCFSPSTWTARAQEVFSYLWSSTKHDASCIDWKEVDGIKPLFHSTQDWRRDQAHSFIDAARRYVGGSPR